MKKRVMDLSKKMELVENFSSDLSSTRADVKSMNRAIEDAVQIKAKLEKVQENMLQNSQKTRVLGENSKEAR